LLVGKPPFETSNVKKTYSRIWTNAYSFPDHINVSEKAKNLVKRILIKEPTKRLNLDEIMSSEFMTANSYPKTLPSSLLVCPPSTAYLK
jgi:polo-like kinase 1